MITRIMKLRNTWTTYTKLNINAKSSAGFLLRFAVLFAKKKLKSPVKQEAKQYGNKCYKMLLS